MAAWVSARMPAESALPTTSAVRGVGLTRNLCTIPRSRSQMTEIPLKMAMNNTLWARMPGAMKSM